VPEKIVRSGISDGNVISGAGFLKRGGRKKEEVLARKCKRNTEGKFDAYRAKIEPEKEVGENLLTTLDDLRIQQILSKKKDIREGGRRIRIEQTKCRRGRA